MLSLRGIAQAIAEQEDSDTPSDQPKKFRNVSKRGPRNSTEFLKFRAAMQRAERQGKQKREAALDFTSGDEKRANALLRQFYRHKDLPQ
jgi:hypothetical protein